MKHLSLVEMKQTRAKNNNYIKAVKVIGVTQIVLVVWAVYILYTSRDAKGFDGFRVFVPYTLFVLLGVANTILYSLHLIRVYKKVDKLDLTASALIIFLFIAVFLFIFTPIADLIG
jgi:hypothetical protein